jgi:hypothetical protein
VADYLPPVISELVAKTDKFRSEMLAAQRSMAAVEKQGGGSFDKLAKVGKAAFFGLGAAAVGFGALAVKGAADQEAANARLQTALANVGSSLSATSAPFKEAEAAARKLGFEDDQATDSMAKLAAATKSPEKAIKALALAEDIARGRHIDLASATDLLVKVETGHYTQLGRLGVITKEQQASITSTTQATKLLADLYGGQASAYSKTFEGRLATLRAETNELAENVGNVLVPKIEAAAHAGNVAIEWLDKHSAAAKALAVVVGGPLVVAMGAYAVEQGLAAKAKLAELFELATTKALALKDAIVADVAAMSALDAASLGAAAVLTAGVTIAVVELNKQVQKQIDVAKNAGEAFARSYLDKIGDAPNKVDLVRQEITKLIQQQYIHGSQTYKEGEAVKVLQKQLRDWAAEALGAAAADKDLGDQQDDTALSAEQLTQKVESIRSALTGELSAQRSYVDAQRRVTDATDAVTQAHRAVDDAMAKAVVDTRAVAEAQRGLRDASEGVASATDRVTAARLKLSEVEKGAAPHDLAEAQLRVSEAVRAQDRAALNLRDRQAALKKIQFDSTRTADDYKSAQLDVADAADGVTKANLDAQQATEELARLQGQGKAGSDELTQAQKDLADAERGLRDAQEQQAAAQDRVNQANQVDPSLTEAVKTAKDRLADAERGLRDAQSGVADSALAAADATAKARTEVQNSIPAAMELRDRLDAVAQAWPLAAPAIAAIEGLLPPKIAAGSDAVLKSYGPPGGIPVMDSGGVVGGPWGAPSLLIGHGGEVMLNPSQQRQVAAAMSGGGVATQSHITNIYLDGRKIAEVVEGPLRERLNKTAKRNADSTRF